MTPIRTTFERGGYRSSTTSDLRNPNSRHHQRGCVVLTVVALILAVVIAVRMDDKSPGQRGGQVRWQKRPEPGRRVDQRSNKTCTAMTTVYHQFGQTASAEK
jgi:hypothetical protein